MNNLLKDQAVALIDGHVLIKDYDSGQVLLDKHNAINYINISLAIASLLGGEQDGSSGSFEISEMHFGNGGSVIDSSGNIQYKTPNTDSEDGELYSATYTKNVADVDSENKVDVIKYSGEVYSDIVVTCTLAYNEPSGQEVLDDSTSMNGNFTFDELGLVTESGKFISHIVFHPIEKSENRKIQVIYTLRIRAGS
jgi:hypothetical protein